jgi:hypothetical protein
LSYKESVTVDSVLPLIVSGSLTVHPATPETEHDLSERLNWLVPAARILPLPVSERHSVVALRLGTEILIAPEESEIDSSLSFSSERVLPAIVQSLALAT